MLKLILSYLLAPTPVSAPAPASKCGKDHLFVGTPVGRARLEHRCQCGLHTLRTYQRRWDKR